MSTRGVDQPLPSTSAPSTSRRTTGTGDQDPNKTTGTSSSTAGSPSKDPANETTEDSVVYWMGTMRGSAVIDKTEDEFHLIEVTSTLEAEAQAKVYQENRPIKIIPVTWPSADFMPCQYLIIRAVGYPEGDVFEIPATTIAAWKPKKEVTLQLTKVIKNTALVDKATLATALSKSQLALYVLLDYPGFMVKRNKRGENKGDDLMETESGFE